MRIRFIKNWTVKQGDGKGPVYKVGQEVEFNSPIEETYARKYVARELAIDVTGESKPEPAKLAVDPKSAKAKP